MDSNISQPEIATKKLPLSVIVIIDMVDMKSEKSEVMFRNSEATQSVVVSTEVPQQRESKTHQTLQPAKMKAVSLSEELNPKPPMETTDKYYTHKDTIHTV